MTGSVQQLDDITAAEARLLETVGRFEESDLAAPSLCQGWTRGHVLAHIALNAHSVVNLLEWARTGVETPQYPSYETRAADIERHSTRTVAEHVAALREAGARFRAAAEALPDDRWDFPVAGIGGSPGPVATYLFGRLREVEVHHVDLDAGYGSADWPEPFVREALDGLPSRFGSRVDESFTIEATDLDLRLTIGDGPPNATVTGPGHALLMWFLRGEDDGLDSTGPLPVLPSWG